MSPHLVCTKRRPGPSAITPRHPDPKRKYRSTTTNPRAWRVSCSRSADEPWFRPASMIDSGQRGHKDSFWWFKRTGSCQGLMSGRQRQLSILIRLACMGDFRRSTQRCSVEVRLATSSQFTCRLAGADTFIPSISARLTLSA
jgi:hypothetical protein